MPAPDPLKVAVAEVVQTDDEVRRRATSFVNLAITRAEGLLRTGAPEVQARLIQSVVPAMVKAVTVDDSADEHAELRSKFEELAAEMRATVADPTIAPEAEPAVDEAPPKPKRKARTSAA